MIRRCLPAEILMQAGSQACPALNYWITNVLPQAKPAGEFCEKELQNNKTLFAF